MERRSLFLLFFFNSLLSSSRNQDVIKANPEDNVILQCNGTGRDDIILLKWVRPDPKPDGYVYFFRENRTYEQYQHPSFRGRVELRDPQLRDGNFSVILKHVGINDTGTYQCFIVENGKEPNTELISIIHLKVEAVQKNLTAEPGDTVTLPCQVPRDTQILVLEWIRPDLEPEYVFWYKNGQSDPDHQHPSFKNRVELKDEQMKDGDLSLILKNVMIDDSGTFECHVFQTQRNHTMSIINLKVEDSGHTSGQMRGGPMVLLVPVLVFVAAIVFVIIKTYRNRRTQSDRNTEGERDNRDIQEEGVRDNQDDREEGVRANQDDREEGERGNQDDREEGERGNRENQEEGESGNRENQEEGERGNRDNQEESKRDNQEESERDKQEEGERDNRDNQEEGERDNQEEGERDNQEEGERDNRDNQEEGERDNRDNQEEGERDNQEEGKRDNQKDSERDNQEQGETEEGTESDPLLQHKLMFSHK